MRHTARNRWVVTGFTALSLIAASCGSDDKANDTTPAAVSSPPATAATTPPSSAPEATTGTSPSETEATEATAATVAPGDGSTVKIGFVNLEGGAVSLPELRIGAETAAHYVNGNGGANTHPLEIVPCNVDGTPEKSIDCANKLVGEGVSVIMEGYDPSSDAMLPVLESAGIPLTGHAAFGPQQQVADNAFFFGTANPSFTAGFLDYYAGQGVKKMMLFLPDNAAFQASADSIVKPISEALGLETKITFYNAANPNFSALATTALAENAEVAATVAPDGDCVGLLGALRAVNFPGKIFLGACSLFAIANPTGSVGVATTSDLWKPTDLDTPPPDKKDELQLYIDTMTAAGHQDLINGFAWDFYSDTVNLSKVIASIDGDVTPASIGKAFTNTKDLDSFMGPTITCDHSAWPGQSACGNKVLLFEIQADGKQKAITPDFIDTSKYIEVLG